MVEKKLYTLEGKLLTPIVTCSLIIKKGKVWIRVVGDLITEKKPTRVYFGKLRKGERKEPDIWRAYKGFVRVTTVDGNETRAKETLTHYLSKDYLGQRTTEGFGKVEWLYFKEEHYKKITTNTKGKKFTIRKGLGPNYHKELQKLLITLMLHDFVKTEKHPSKIFREITIIDEEIREACLYHHNGEERKNELLPLVKYYDQLAAYMSRKSRMKTTTRYDYENGKIDFEQLAKEIEERQGSAYKLYNYIYQSKELRRIVESMTYRGKSLRSHLLLMVNLAVGDFIKGRITLQDEKIVSTLARKRGKLAPAKSAEMHSFVSMNKAESRE